MIPTDMLPEARHHGRTRPDLFAAAGLTPGVPMGPTPVWVVHQPWPL